MKKNFLTLALTAALGFGIAAPANAINPQVYEELLRAQAEYERKNYAEINRKAEQRVRESQIAYEKDKAARQKKAMQVKTAQTQQIKKAPAIKYKKKSVKKRAYKHQRKANNR